VRRTDVKRDSGGFLQRDVNIARSGLSTSISRPGPSSYENLPPGIFLSAFATLEPCNTSFCERRDERWYEKLGETSEGT
jgi:hypothetical protein